MPSYFQSMSIYTKNIPAKFHPDPIWSDGALCWFRWWWNGNYRKFEFTTRKYRPFYLPTSVTCQIQ